ncbi:MAG: ABC transporter substrate-binding protein [Anaerolineae bacterium]|jgi:peptide/nickel transport system substrate-binding protein|nr:ABC transporter substrate-binding protein [Anaerolineae bacterium]
MLIHRTKVAVAALVCLCLLAVNAVLAQGSELRVGVPAPVDLNPATGSNDPETLFNRMIYDYLLDVAPDGSLVNQLASSYSISEDGLTYTLTLVAGVTFSDGSPLTAADVVFSFNYLKEAGSPALNLLGDFVVAAGDDGTVIFTLAQPNADFLFGIASRWSFILKDGTTAPNVIAEGADPYASFIGTGAFILSDYRPGESATFVKNPSYWIAGQPLLDTVTHIYIDDAQAQIDALRGGTVDFIFKVAFDRVAELEAEGLNVIIKPTNQHPVIRIRSDAGFLGEDVRVRQAFKLATDREILNLNLFDGNAIIGNNDPIGPLYGPFYDDTLAQPEYDPAAACALLAEAGYPDGLGADEPLMLYIDDSFNYVQMAEFLKEQWAEGCINVELLPRNPGDYYAGDMDTAEWMTVDLGITGWGSRPIPQQYLVEAYVTGASFNESHWSDAELDALVAEAAVTADIEARAAIYARIAAIFAERGPIIVPFFAPIVGVTAPGVTGLDMHPFPGSTDLRTVTVNR